MSTLGSNTAWVQVAPDGSAFKAKTEAIVNSAVRGLNPNVSIGMSLKPDVAAKLGSLTAGTAALRKNLANLKIGITDTSSLAKLTVLQARAVTLQNVLSKAAASGNVTSPDQLLGSESKYLSIAAAIEAVSTASSDATKHTSLFGSALAALQSHTETFGGTFNGLLPEILSSVSGWHLLSEAVIETTAIWGPAAVAISAFGLVGYKTGKEIYTQFMNMNTASQALNQTMPGLSGNFAKMEAAAKPQVIQLLGDALLIAGKQGSTFSTIASDTGSVLDKLGAKAVAAFMATESGGKMAQTAASDVQMLGIAFGHLGSLIGELLTVVPGYATDLLKIGTAALGVAADVVKVAEPVLRLGLAFHGAWIYLGLLGTLMTKVVTGALASLSGIALKGALGLDSIGLGGTAAAAGLTEVGAAMETVASLPWGVISTAAIGFILLADHMDKATDATQRWIAAEQSAVQQASLANVLAVNSAALTATNERLTSATTAYEKSVGGATSAQAASNKEMAESPALVNPVTGAFSALGNQVVKASANVTELTSAQQGFIKQSQLVQSRLSGLSKQFGGNAAAMALMNAAGITTAQITDTNNSNWAQTVIQMQAQAAGFKELTLGSGQYGAAVNALGNNLETYDGQMSKITQAQETLMGTITGSESAFTSWAQGLNTLGSDSTATSTAMTGLSKSSSWSALKSAANQLGVSISGIGTQSKAFGVLSAAAKKSTTYVGGLSSTSLQLTSDFYSSVTGAQSLISSLENQGISTKNLTKTVATQASQMLSYAGGNKAAEATIISLINDAVGPGTVSFSNLNTWVKHNSTSMSGLDAIVGQTTIAAAGMAGTIGTLTKTLFAQDLMLASGVTPAVNAYAQSIAKSGQNSDATKTARAQLIKDLENSGLSAQNAANYVNNLTTGLNNLPKNVNTNINDNLTGNGTIKATSSITGQSTSMIGQLKFVAAGGHITGAGTGTSDSIPAMLSNGEYVVNAGAVSKYGKGMMDAINGKHFAAGGLASTVPAALTTIGNMIPDSNNWSTTFAQNAGTAFAKAASTQAQSESILAGGGGGASSVAARSGSAAQAQAFAAAHLGSFGWGADQMPALIALWNQESGWNANAVNPSSGAYGIPQSLGHGHPYNLGDYANQILWGLTYIKSRYGSPDAAEAHELSNHWYAQGGLVGQGHGYSAGGVTPEGIIGVGMRSGSPYTIGTGEYVGPLMGNSIGAMTGGNTNLLIPILQEQNRLLAKANQIAAGTPQNYAQGLNNAVNGGVNRAYFAAGS